VCWAIGSNLFTAAARRMGAGILNRHRLLVGAVLVASILWVTHGSPWPLSASRSQILILVASGLIGFVFGDTWFIRALVILGPGRAGLMASLAPLMTAALCWVLLGERLGPLAWFGTLLIVGGVAWVMSDRRTREHARLHGHVTAGVIAGVLAALGQAVGYVLSKMALRTGIDPLSANTIRITSAAVAIWMFTAARGEIRQTVRALEDRGAAAFMLAGTVFGPVLGVSLSLLALQFIEAGVAGSITAVYPVLALAISSRFHREPLTARTLLGAVLAIAGVIVLFLR
jgi:drug/metabolite transporter (DMT)-like permease